MKHFVFLYPIPEYIDFRIEQYSYSIDLDLTSARKSYSELLNKCIDVRYRKNNFKINYVIFPDSKISTIITLHPGDAILKTNIDYQTHVGKNTESGHPYPDEQFILDQLQPVRELRVAGFHMWDCVDKFAKKAYEQNIATLVDEDLTEFFESRITDPDFRLPTYPTFDARRKIRDFDVFMNKRKSRPWLWQKY